MSEHSYDTRRPVAALATPWGKSALAVIRTAGEGCIKLLAPFFSQAGKLKAAANGTMLFGYLKGSDGKVVEQVQLAVFKAPHGYTGQESVEIYTHGSPPGIDRVLRLLYAAGFTQAAPGEFTLRAFLSGKMDLTEAEAVADIINAKSDRAHEIALGRLSGSLFRRITEMKDGVLQLLSGIEVLLDYPEEELLDAPEPDMEKLNDLKKRIMELSETYRGGKLYQEGVKVALAGRTNAGKSSLFNLFLKEDRSIVSEIHGTTRDYIESWISIDGIPVRLFDTAGFRDAGHSVEAEGIRRSSMLVDSADLVIYLLDATNAPSEEEKELICREEEAGEESRYIFISSRSDLAVHDPYPRLLSVSAVRGDGFDQLQRLIAKKLLRGAGMPEEDVLVDSIRQKQLLDKAANALAQAYDGFSQEHGWDEIAMDLRTALDALGEITGEVTSADILEAIFSGFCVGK
jgi:tRNA modification GTPase